MIFQSKSKPDLFLDLPAIGGWWSAVIFIAVLTGWMLQTGSIHESWTESTRLAAIESLVERGTWRIDASPYGHETGDKLLLDGHYYSDKPPLFAAMGAVFYALLYYGLGARLAVNGCQPGTVCVYYWLTIFMVGIPSAAMAALFYRLVWRQLGSVAWATGLTALLCFGTVVWPYSLVFNHHLPAAMALFVSFYLLAGQGQTRFHLAEAGLLAGTAVMFDLTAIFPALALLGIALAYHRSYVFLFVAGALFPGVATVIFDYQITGGPLLPYFSGQGYQYPGSPFEGTVGGQHAPQNIWLYAFRSLIGDFGLLGYCPLLLLALAGLIRVVRQTSQPLALKGTLILTGIAGQVIFILSRTDNFGGDAYGGRFFIPLIPILFFFSAFILPQLDRRRLAVGWSVAVLISVFSAYQGVKATWHQVSPPFFVALLPGPPYLAVETNLSLPQYPLPDLSKNRRLRQFELPPIPNRLDLNLNNELILLGYDLPSQRVEPGQELKLTLYWQSQRVTLGDYFVFTHLLDARQARVGGLDRRLQEGYPLKFWYPGEIVTDRRRIPVDRTAPSGLGWLRVGVYELVDHQAKPVPIMSEQQNEGEETSIALGPVFIGASPFVVSRDDLKPQTRLAVPWGNPPIITLRGYDWVRTEKNLQLTLYWESGESSRIDYTLFVHLLDQPGKIAAQVDQPPVGGQYPTSLWQAGEIIRDEVSLPLSTPLPPGRYELQVGWYNPATGERLAVPDAPGNSFSLASLEIN